MNSLNTSLLIFFSLLLGACHQPPEKSVAAWPEVHRETKPWTRWWWHGNAVTKEGITAEMEAYKKAGIGGLELTPVFGVYGAEDQFVQYLSPAWVDLLVYTLKEADRLGLGVDMATGTGWPFGGPWINAEHACKDVDFKVYELKEGQRLGEKVERIQQPYLRMVGNQIYDPNYRAENNHYFTKVDARKFTIKQLAEPVSANKNLQSLALDQVKFEKPMLLQALMAYSDKGDVLDLSKNVSNGTLDWVAPEGNWKLYAVFEGWHGKMVERAAPGGEGNVIDHFSAEAIEHYLQRFDSALNGQDIKSLRAFFNDSYEVDDARGSADWTPGFFDEFEKRKGYDLRQHLPALFGKDDPEKNKRILCDYRETISELVLDNFTLPWKAWSHKHEAIMRDQAHGSPSNILDLYAAADIPETEGTEPLRIKMATSAGNVSGKKLISSESATWLNEHFLSNLSDVKVAVDRFLVNGVNHIFYHGTAYSPAGDPWPGRLFYAAVHLNPRNSLWNDFHALNTYIARSQSFLQTSTPDQDVLLYFPVYDRFSTPGLEMIEHFDGVGRQFDSTAFQHAAESMLEKGYAFDYISDRQIEKLQRSANGIRTEGNALYKTIVLPKCQYIPLKTFSKIVDMVKEGATVIAYRGLPAAVSGFKDVKENTTQFNQLLSELKKNETMHEGITELKYGKGKILTGDDLEKMLAYAATRKETMVTRGLSFVRKKRENGHTIYFIVNNNDQTVNDWISLHAKGDAVILYDPMDGQFGAGKVRNSNENVIELYVNIQPKQTLIVELVDGTLQVDPYHYHIPSGDAVSLDGTWKVTFTNGGPVLPASVETDSLTSWTAFSGDDYNVFSGTASYTTTFEKPSSEQTEGWVLDLGKVKESAEVHINGKLAGTLIGPSFQLYINNGMLKDGGNKLEVKVSNLMANRIADMDEKNIFWKKFYNVNFPARKPENRKGNLFDASQWQPIDAGLLGPVRIIPVKKE